MQHTRTVWRNYMNEDDSMCDGENIDNVTENADKPFPTLTYCSKILCNSASESDGHGKENAYLIKSNESLVNAVHDNQDKFSSCVDSPHSNGLDNIAITKAGTKKKSPIEAPITDGFVVNGYDCITSGIVRYQKDNEVKLKHISFDSPHSNEKEYTLKPCPSLDSSLGLQSCSYKRNHGELVQTLSSSDNTPFLENQFRQLIPQSSLPPATPLTPASGIISQASLDSGVLSAHSFDFSQNFSLEVLDKRKRTASSVSSGIGEMWQSSLDGDSSKDTTFNETSIHKISVATPSLINNEPISSEKLNSAVDINSCRDFLIANDSFAECTSDIDLHSSCQQQRVDHSFPECSDVTSTVIFPVASCESSSFCVVQKNVKVLSPNSQCSKEEEAAKPCSIFVENLNCNSSNYASIEKKEKIEKYALNLVMLILNEAFAQSVSLGWSIKCSGQCNQELCREDFRKKSSSREKKGKENEKLIFSTLGVTNCSSSLCWTPELPFSPSHRGYSRTSKRSSLSFSHDSLVWCPPCQDDSHLIKGAISHDVLTFSSKKPTENKIAVCNICLDDDVYALPVDMVKNFDGPVLQPKVIIQQPTKKSANKSIRLRNNESDMRVSSKRARNNVAKEKCKKLRHKSKHNNIVSVENRRHSSNAIADNLERNLCYRTNISDNNIEKYSTVSQHEEKNRLRQRKESKCLDQGKLCKIIPFTSGKNSTKRKEISCDVINDKKRNRSLSSNIRNTLFALFGLKKAQKEHTNFVNAKNEFIEASSQELSDSSDGMKWGKICPLPSAPPLVTSVKYSAFTEQIGSVKTSTLCDSSGKHECLKKNSNNTNASIESNSCQRQSNSISPSSLLSCLGHPRTNSIDEHDDHRGKSRKSSDMAKGMGQASSFTVTNRALPPLPSTNEEHGSDWKPHAHKLDEGCDFASIIGKVKNYGWYWGPISGEAAEKVLANEPDGSFIVRDSSDYHYIFSLTFRLNGVTRHVRIEHDHGNFSFGGVTRFKSQTIVDFIEKAVEHSRSGRYLFFLHRRPVLGPMRVQLLHPVSRFKHVQSLQHLCRFVIVKQVRKDLIHDLPLPQRLKDYLSSPHYYSEQVEQCMSSSALSLEGATAPSEDDGHKSSPCLHHSSQLRFNNDKSSSSSSSSSSSNSNDITNETSIVPQNSIVRLCPNRISLQEPLNMDQFRNTRCSSTQAGSSFGITKHHRNKEYRLSSSHSSLENSFLQMYPASPSTISSSSVSGRQNGNFYSSKLSLKRKGTPSFWSTSHSSPSSPVPFDYSPDCLSSSDDLPFSLTSKCPVLVQKQIEASKPTAITVINATSTVPTTVFQPKSSLDKSRLKKSPTERDCGPSASSSTSQCVLDAFVSLNERRKLKKTPSEVLAPPHSYSVLSLQNNKVQCSADKLK